MQRIQTGPLVCLALVLAVTVCVRGWSVVPGATLVVDLNAEETDEPSGLGSMLEMDGLVYFVADDGVHGLELWRTDGTDEGTSLVADRCPGSCSTKWSSELFGGKSGIYLIGSGPNWFSDGTNEGTLPLSWRLAGIRYGAVTSLGQLFVRGDLQDYGTELWMTGPELSSARQVEDLCPGSCESHPWGMLAFGERVVFVADDTDSGTHKVWITDGGPHGTFLLSDEIDHLILQTFRSPFVRFGDSVFFAEGDSFHSEYAGTGFWRSDGTPLGTYEIIDLPNEGETHGPFIFRVADELFLVQDLWPKAALWKSDGSAAGTVLVLQFPALASEYLQYLDQFVQVGEDALFVRSSLEIAELWSTDGTAAGTRLVRDGFVSITGLTSLGNAAVFRGEKPGSQPGLWRTDGTQAGTFVVAGDIEPEEKRYSESYLRFGDVVLFEAMTDEKYRGELWRSDGTAAGTWQVHNINKPRSSSDPRSLMASADHVLFLARPDGAAERLVTSDGTAGGTHVLNGFEELFFDSLSTVGEKVVFLTRGLNQDGSAWISSLWFTPMGLADPQQLCTACQYQDQLTAVGDMLYFNAWDESTGRTIWRSDGSPEGTARLGSADLNWGTEIPFDDECTSYPRYFTALADRVCFLGSTENEGVALWQVQNEQIQLVASLPFSPCSWLEVVAVGDLLYLTDGTALWLSDGTPEGTFEVTVFGGRVRNLTPYAGMLTLLERFYSTEIFGDRLLKISGTAIEVVSELDTEAPGSRVTEMVATDELLYLSVYTEQLGQELWASDGTAAGTRLVRDIFPGIRGSNPVGLTPIGSRVVFAADDGIAGHEMWSSDGTQAGTFLVDNINPGRYASSPSDFTQVGAKLYFAADDGTGRELWSLPVSALENIVFRDGFESGGTTPWSETTEQPK